VIGVQQDVRRGSRPRSGYRGYGWTAEILWVLRLVHAMAVLEVNGGTAEVCVPMLRGNLLCQRLEGSRLSEVDESDYAETIRAPVAS
jgi:hypothetical protein